MEMDQTDTDQWIDKCIEDGNQSITKTEEALRQRTDRFGKRSEEELMNIAKLVRPKKEFCLAPLAITLCRVGGKTVTDLMIRGTHWNAMFKNRLGPVGYRVPVYRFQWYII